ncbi:hypothetical protein EV188_101607 [Actinomycetospora succinea]|uniref:Uncharacterized protein n=1 Tax=Actinomycetospora succinea TaxID=663603 RepID=A0A4R6VRY0_9PSEU|nr:hypothetical protein [Actinomycetospora succinea]TDQ65357.1 hypothetical protein EV188_101607 [Actinomycetospora succinea]
MTAPDDDLVAGEPRRVLRRALSHLSTQRRDDGSLELLGEVPPDLADPLMRALERVAGELVDDDERRGEVPRSGGRLHADAFVALLLRVTDTPADQA